jgi:hypothetical protein
MKMDGTLCISCAVGTVRPVGVYFHGNYNMTKLTCAAADGKAYALPWNPDRQGGEDSAKK